MDVDQYLRTSFDDAECEFLDGEVVDRNTGEWLHGSTLANLIYLLGNLRRPLGIRVLPIIRIRTAPNRIRVADLAVWRDDNIGDRIAKVPPFLAVEVLSSQDRSMRMHQKVQEYLTFGVEWIWVIDPEDRSALTFSRQNPGGIACDVLRTSNPDIEIPLSAAFDLDA